MVEPYFYFYSLTGDKEISYVLSIFSLIIIGIVVSFTLKFLLSEFFSHLD